MMKKNIVDLKIEKLTLSGLYDIYSADIYRYSFSILKNYEEAKDALQETFARYAESENSFKGQCSQKTWLFVIARNYCLNRLKNENYKSRKHIENIFPESNELDLDLLISLKEALQKLNQEYCELIFLADYSGYSYKEIAYITQQSIANVKIKIFRARNELRRLLNER
jgi:RNA polymerase sigma-70 factor (ECF subfamily)